LDAPLYLSAAAAENINAGAPQSDEEIVAGMRTLQRLTIATRAAAAPRRDTYEEERREVLDSVFQALRRQTRDPDEMAACAFLAEHLFLAAP